MCQPGGVLCGSTKRLVYIFRFGFGASIYGAMPVEVRYSLCRPLEQLSCGSPTATSLFLGIASPAIRHTCLVLSLWFRAPAGSGKCTGSASRRRMTLRDFKDCRIICSGRANNIAACWRKVGLADRPLKASVYWLYMYLLTVEPIAPLPPLPLCAQPALGLVMRWGMPGVGDGPASAEAWCCKQAWCVCEGHIRMPSLIP
jgi:hypothetical protein